MLLTEIDLAFDTCCAIRFESVLMPHVSHLAGMVIRTNKLDRATKNEMLKTGAHTEPNQALVSIDLCEPALRR